MQQAIYSRIPDAERMATHWQVGRLMLGNTPAERREEQIFALVAQLNHGLELLGSRAERDELAGLNLLAARKAKLSVAYQPANTYAQIGLGSARPKMPGSGSMIWRWACIPRPPRPPI